MPKPVVTSNAHLEELAPSTAKMSQQDGYDTLDPDETRAYIADALRIYSKQYWPYKIRSRRNPISAFKTTWKIKHDGKHIGDINLETDKTHGVRLGYGISKAIVKDEKRRWYAAHVKMVAQHAKARIDIRFKVGEWWDIRGIPTTVAKRQEWLQIARIIEAQEREYASDYSYGDAETPNPTFEDMEQGLRSHGIKCSRRRLNDILKAYKNGHLDHLKKR